MLEKEELNNEESFGANLKHTVKNKNKKGKRRGRRKMESILEFCFCILRPGPQIPKLKIQKQISKNICILYPRPGQPKKRIRATLASFQKVKKQRSSSSSATT